jgi:chromosome segregation ATPase
MVRLFAFVIFAFSSILLWPQTRHRDPLNNLEIDQLRETAQEPDQRLKLLVQFTRARLDEIQKVRTDPKAVADRPQQVHDRLEDFSTLYDELDDNISMYADRRADIRKPLKGVIEADAEFKAKLEAFKESATPAELQQCEFLLTNALEAVTSGLDDHQKLLAEQEEAAKKKKSKK